MTSPAITMAWIVLIRQRTGFIVAMATFLATAIVFPIMAAVAPPVVTALTGALPVLGVFAFVLNALLFAEDQGSLSSRYPRYMLTLPLETRTLALWPTLFTSLGAGLLWVAAALLIYRPSGYPFPVVVPAVGLTAVMAWVQALAWLPITTFLIREIVNIVLVAGLAALPIWLQFTGRASTLGLSILLASYILTAYMTAWAAMTSDRHGQRWRFWPARLSMAAPVRPVATVRRRRPFRRPEAAQLWFEWNCHGLALNGFVGVTLLSIWTVLLVTGRHGSPEWFAMILVLLITVITAMIASSGTSLGFFTPIWRHSRGAAQLSPFVATRPMSTGRLVTAKFRMAAESVLWTWSLALVGVIVWIVVSGNGNNATIVARDFFNRYPGGRGFAILALACVLLPALSWRFLTGSVVPILTGRRWVCDSAAWLFLVFVAGLVTCAAFLAHHLDYLPWFFSVVPWLVGMIAALKAIVAVTAFRAALRQRLMSPRNITGVVSLWLFLTGCGIAMTILIGPISAVPVSWPFVALGAAVLVPLGRFPLAVLALDWNRHR